jgi:TonB family protein
MPTTVVRLPKGAVEPHPIARRPKTEPIRQEKEDISPARAAIASSTPEPATAAARDSIVTGMLPTPGLPSVPAAEHIRKGGFGSDSKSATDVAPHGAVAVGRWTTGPAVAAPIAAAGSPRVGVLPSSAGWMAPVAAADGSDGPAELIRRPIPEYPDEARRLGIRGKVQLEVQLLATGDVQVLRVVRGLGHGLDEAAVAAVKKIVFRPAMKNGQPVDVVVKLNVLFELG